MDTAEFKTMRETLGMTVADVAKALEVNERTVQRWEQYNGDTPPLFATTWLEDRWAIFQDRVGDVLAGLDELEADYGEASALVLSRYVTDESARVAGEFGMTARQHAALVGLVKFVVELEDFDCVVRWRDVE